MTFKTKAALSITTFACFFSNLSTASARQPLLESSNSQPALEESLDLYRLYNRSSGEHFYTSRTEERNSLIHAGWKDEGTGWVAPGRSNTPVYRLYNSNAGDHHYTLDPLERTTLIQLGWDDEGIGWYSDDAKTVALYREYNPNAKTGSHHYTTSFDEHSALVSAGWKDEGIAWYAIKPGTAGSDSNINPQGTYLTVINKKNPISRYMETGENPEAHAALMELIATMQSQRLNISNSYSGFRSYDDQSRLYHNYCALYGQAQADTFSARPGYSEHESGLAFDLLHTNGELVTGAKESQWLLDHAHEFGFIVRYRSGKEAITGYVAEPWHLRYVGAPSADIARSGLTLEEYLGVEGGDYD